MIEIENLTYKYPFSEVPALKELSLSVKKGELVLITGPTAAGKTTLCLAMAGILQHEYEGTLEGSVSFMGRPVLEYSGIGELNQHISMVFDDADAQLIFTSVEEEVASGLSNRDYSKEEMISRLKHVTELAGISHLNERPPYVLSGGQKQRVAIAAVLAMDTEVIILDEPTSELDVTATAKVIGILKKLKSEGKTIIVVDHSLEGYREVADRVICMKDGRIKEEGSFSAIYPEPFISYEFSPDASGMNNYKEPAGTEPIISIRNISKSFGDFRALDDVSVNIYSGEFVAVFGENGSGKTTLIRHLNGLLKSDSGFVKVMGLNATEAKVTDLVRHTGLVFQNPDKMLFADTAADEIRFGLDNIGAENPEEKISEVLEMVGLLGRETVYPGHLSRGERQRLAVACILAIGPEIIVLDEPTTGLDGKESDVMMELMKRLNRLGHTIIMVTHNTRIVNEYADRVITMEAGKITGDYCAA